MNWRPARRGLTAVLIAGLLAGSGVPGLADPVLRNGSFNDPFVTWHIDGRPEYVAQHWTPFVDGYSAVVPEFKPNYTEYRDPPSSQWVWSSYSSYQCGLYQTVGGCTPGESYTFQVWILSIYGAAGGDPVPGDNIGKQLAVDLYGGVDWLDPGLLRGAEDFRDRRAYFGYLSFTAESPTTTLFIHINNRWPAENCQALWDAALLYSSPVTTANQSQVAPLPSYTLEDSFPVQWGLVSARAAAPPPSPPVAYSYDVQYQVDGGPWTTWLTNTFATTATFGAGNPATLEMGRTYGFRCRAHDATGGTNEGRVWGWVEQYPATPDAQTAYLPWTVSGRVWNNGADGVPGALVTLTGSPAAQSGPDWVSTTTGAFGEFTAGVPATGTYALTVTPTILASDYGTLPPYTLEVLTNVVGVELLLPPAPAGDMVQNGDLEDDPPLAGWHVGGDAPPTVTASAHTGHRAALLSGGAGWSWLTQTLTLSGTVISPTLSFAYACSTTAPADTFDVWVQGEGTGVVTVTHTSTPTTWTYVIGDLGRLTGTVTLHFRVYQSSALAPTLAWVDEVHVGPRAAPLQRLYLPLTHKTYLAGS